MHCPVPDVCWMNRSTFKPCLWGNLPRKSCPTRASRPRLSIRAYGFPAPNSSHLEAETLMDLSAALRQVGSWCWPHANVCIALPWLALLQQPAMELLTTFTLVLPRIQRSPPTMSCRPPDGSTIRMDRSTTMANTICEFNALPNTSHRCPGFWGKPSQPDVRGRAMGACTSANDSYLIWQSICDCRGSPRLSEPLSRKGFARNFSPSCGCTAGALKRQYECLHFTH